MEIYQEMVDKMRGKRNNALESYHARKGDFYNSSKVSMGKAGMELVRRTDHEAADKDFPQRELWYCRRY